MNAIQFSLLQPSPQLSRDVESIRVTTHPGSVAAEVSVCPSGYPGIVFQLAKDGTAAIERIVMRRAQQTEIPLLFLHGQDSEPSVMHFKAIPFTTIQVVFKSHALYSLFGFDASTLRGGSLPPEQFGAKELERTMLLTQSNTERVTLIEQFLIERLEQTNKRDELIEQMLTYMRERIAELSVRRVLSDFPISERQFQKRFARVVGMPPQLYIRLIRVNEAIRLLKSRQFDRLADVAYQLNYFDQSHFIREMKRFSFINPKSLTMQERGLHVDETGASYT
ncbi:helix-turn-helix domain-containing protein [Paenibacillus chartarius]|uniref:Helix-turn-helix domain-containing protein n=1 Tax=Paenibacillus chartarius TaxID=747481 RepID=A0ABV6DM58_9BACL